MGAPPLLGAVTECNIYVGVGAVWVLSVGSGHLDGGSDVKEILSNKPPSLGTRILPKPEIAER